jgi:putative endonuclease
VARPVRPSVPVKFFVYIVTNTHHTVLYIGVTNDLQRRMETHQLGVVGAFSTLYRTNKLVYFEETSDIRSAIEREKELKGWRREKKVGLIESLNPEWRDLMQEYPSET